MAVASKTAAALVLRLRAAYGRLSLRPAHVSCQLPLVQSLAPLRMRRTANGEVIIVPSAMPLGAWFYRSRFVGWLCLCLRRLKALALSCHKPSPVSEIEPGIGSAVADIFGVPDTPVQPADGRQKLPLKHTFAGAFHLRGCCTTIFSGVADLPCIRSSVDRVASYGITGFASRTFLSNTNVRGPPAHLA